MFIKTPNSLGEILVEFIHMLRFKCIILAEFFIATAALLKFIDYFKTTFINDLKF